MTRTTPLLLSAWLVLGAAASPGQTAYSRTYTVDASGNADYTTIQGAIDAITTLDGWTVWVYPGTYAEAVTLGGANISIVGVDRERVVVQPMSEADTVTITGDGARNVAIRNLTLRTSTSGIGRSAVRITGDAPSGVALDRVNIYIDAEASWGVRTSSALGGITMTNLTIRGGLFTGIPLDLASASGIRLADSDIRVLDGHCLLGSNTEVVNTTILVDLAPGTPGSDHDDTAAIWLTGVENIRIQGCRLRGRMWGLRCLENVRNLTVVGSEIVGSHFGVEIECGDNIRFESTSIRGDSAVGGLPVAPTPAAYHGVFIRGRTASPSCAIGSIRFVSCDIAAVSDRKSFEVDAYGVLVADAPGSMPVEIVGGAITASAGSHGRTAFGVLGAGSGSITLHDVAVTAFQTATGTNTRRAFGVKGEAVDAVRLFGGSVLSSDASERETDQFDLWASVSRGIAVSGTRFSKWFGAIGCSERKRAVVQRVPSVSQESATRVLDTAFLTGSEQAIFTFANEPDGYRVLSVTGNQAGMNQTVFIIGKNFAGQRIADAIQLNGTATVAGLKPFAEVDTVYLPAQTAGGQAVSVGVTKTFGLHAPIALSSDVLFQGRKAGAATSFTFEAIGTVNTTYSTVTVSGLADLDSVEFSYNASQ